PRRSPPPPRTPPNAQAPPTAPLTTPTPPRTPTNEDRHSAPVRREPPHSRRGDREAGGRGSRRGLGRGGVRLRLAHRHGIPRGPYRTSADRRGHHQRLLPHPGADRPDRRGPRRP